MLYHPLGDAVEVALAHRGKIGRVGVSNRVEPVNDLAHRVTVLIIKTVDAL